MLAEYGTSTLSRSFAGEMSVSRGLTAMGYTGASMDLRRDKRHNVLQPVGLITLLALVMRLRPGALLWMAPVCSTWVWMSRGTTGRRELSGPLSFVSERFQHEPVGVREWERNPARFDEPFQSLIV